MKMTKFVNDEKRGREAVDKVIDYSKKRGYKIREATEDEQKLDIDLYINDIPVEVKLMTFPSALCIEETGSGDNNGWLQISQAKKIIFVSDSSMYLMDMDELRTFYAKVKKLYRLNYNIVSYGVFQDIWQSTFRVIPLDSFKQYTKIKEIKL
jgi:ribose 5-phosphate isomerase